LEFDTPDDFDSKYANLIKTTSGKIEKIVNNISKKTNSKNKKSNYNENYNQYLLLEIVNRALTDVLENTKSQTSKTK